MPISPQNPLAYKTRGLHETKGVQVWHAFTLVELLVVVAILSILASIAGMRYVAALHRAERSACQQNLRTLHTALMAYQLDYNRFPLADGVADNKARPDKTEYGCGPAANGFWSGVSRLLVELNYTEENTLFCPALQRRHSRPIEAYSECSDTAYAKQTVPQWRFLRYAYNSAAQDAGGTAGGEHDIEHQQGREVWLLRCLHLDVGQFNPERDIPFPFRIKQDPENPNITWYGEFELTVGGEIRLRPVEPRRTP